jgi:hypothetical protein
MNLSRGVHDQGAVVDNSWSAGEREYLQDIVTLIQWSKNGRQCNTKTVQEREAYAAAARGNWHGRDGC